MHAKLLPFHFSPGPPGPGPRTGAAHWVGGPPGPVPPAPRAGGAAGGAVAGGAAVTVHSCTGHEVLWQRRRHTRSLFMRSSAFIRVLSLASQRGVAGRAGGVAYRKLQANLLRVRASAVTAHASAVTAHASAVTARASADVGAANAGAARSYVVAGIQAAAFICALGLLADLYVHEAPEHIAYRVRCALRASAGGGPAPEAGLTLPVPQPPPVLGYKPLMLLGPTGCGKSTLLARIAREAASSHTPCVLVRWRLSEGAKREAAAVISEPAENPLAFASDALFQQIDYPQRRALLVSVLKGVVDVMRSRTQADLALPETRERLLHTLRVLFAAAAEVQGERIAAGMPTLAAAPLLLFDGVHDLVKDERLARAGGAAVFKALALLLIGYCVDRHAVRAVVAGSSAELDAAFRAAAPYNSRWSHYELRDPDASAVTAALHASGYCEEDARALVEECGTRMRLLEGPLLHGAQAAPAADFLEDATAAGDDALGALLGDLPAADALGLARALTAVAAADAAGSAGVAGAARPLAKDLPPAARAAGEAYAGVVYADRRGRAHFQSRSVARAWERWVQGGSGGSGGGGGEGVVNLEA